MKNTNARRKDCIGIGEEIEVTYEEGYDSFRCLCGSSGEFFDCEADGFPLNHMWGTSHYVRCETCDRIINRKTLRVEGMFGKYVWVPDESVPNGVSLLYVPHGEKAPKRKARKS